MRRLVATAALTVSLVAAPAPTLGHPGHGPTQIQVGDNFFRPAASTIAIGDTVIWTWTGPAGDHSVTADSGQAESFDSDPGKQPAEIHHANFAFSHTFTHLGSFAYGCRVHPAMRGEITVIAAPAADVTDPRLTNVSLRPRRVCPRHTDRCRATRAYLRLTASEPATLVFRFDRRGRAGWRAARTSYLRVNQGRVRERIRVGGLRPAVYRLRLVAYDGSDNRSPTIKLRFRVKSP
jgi:plastocyanin